MAQFPAPSGQTGVQMPHPNVGFLCHANALPKEKPSSFPVVFYKACGTRTHAINILVSYLATKNVVRASRVCSSLSQGGFSLDSVFFPFAARCYFMAIRKSSADTNVGQNRNLTHCTKSLYRYNLSLSIFKRSPLFVRQSLTNAISLPLIHSISSKHVFRAVSDFGNRKKIISNLTLQVQFSPPRPGKGQFPTPETALSVKFPTPRGTENSQMPAVCDGEGGGGS